MLNDEFLSEVFAALGAHLAEAGAEISIVVVGGANLALRGVVERTTKDVDVIARVTEHDGEARLVPPVPFPEVLQQAIRRVARDFGLSPDWMNAVVGRQWETGLPPQFGDEIEWHQFDGLAVGLVGRRALITLKFFAAVDQGARSVHWQDLIALEPTDEEIQEAARWVTEQDAGADYFRFVRRAEERLRDELDRN